MHQEQDKSEVLSTNLGKAEVTWLRLLDTYRQKVSVTIKILLI